MKLPWCKFWPRDWISDSALRLCSYAARGLWADLLCLMFMNEARCGYLELSGKPLTDPVLIARVTGGDPAEAAKLLDELKSARVFSVDKDGCIYSRRIVADAERREAGRVNGVRGGNPSLRVNPPGYPDRLGGGLNSEAEYRGRGRVQKQRGTARGESPRQRPSGTEQDKKTGAKAFPRDFERQIGALKKRQAGIKSRGHVNALGWTAASDADLNEWNQNVIQIKELERLHQECLSRFTGVGAPEPVTTKAA